MRFRKTAMSLIVAVMVAASVFAQGVTETQSAVSAYTTDASPKYVFMFIGDGMSSPQTNAAQVYNGNNVSGAIELEKLTFTQFPVVGLQYTQDSTSFCPDSASTATSLSSGFKTHSGVIGMGVDKVTAGETIAEKVKQQLGWKVGIISSVTLNHATPAAYYAHIASRNDYYEIGEQMAASGFDYFAGGSLLENDGDALYEVLEDAGYTVTSDRDTILSLNADSGKVYAVSPELQDDGAMKYALDMDDDDITLAEQVQQELEKQCSQLPKAQIAGKSLMDWGAIVVVPNIMTAVAIANRVAPEHLELCVRDPWALLPHIRHAGAIFMGQHSPEPVGDYFAGPNHVLPTLRTARFSSALSVQNFCKKTSIVATSPAFLLENAPAIASLARLEGLEAHARSALIRTGVKAGEK